MRCVAARGSPGRFATKCATFPSVKQAPRKIEELLGPARMFRLSLGERLRALVVGVPAYIRRKRLIEDLLEAKLQELRDLRAQGATDEQLHARAQAFDLRRINELVDRHNRYYPIEANLPLDPRHGEMLERGQRWMPLDHVTPDTLLERLATQRNAPETR